MSSDREVETLESLPTNVYTFPVSFAQERLWYLHQLEPESPAHIVSMAFRLKGLLNVAALEQSINSLVRRHGILRSTFSLQDGEVVQLVHPVSPIALSIKDLRHLREPERQEKLQHVLLEHARRPFALDCGPVFRVGLIQNENDEHVFHLNMHHIVSDEWSTGVLFRELSILYKAYGSGKPSPLPELPIQYADYSVWQRDWLQGENLENQLSYWRKQLSGLTTVDLPIDRLRPAVQTYCGGKHAISVSPAVCHQLKSLSRQEGVTFFTTLLAAFQIYLHRYTGQDDVPVGTPIADRTCLETERLIGFFLNTLVIRTDITGNPTVKEFLARVRRVTLDAYDHQGLPFERLVQEINPTRDPSRSPLFQILFVFHGASKSDFVLPNLQVNRVSIPSEVAKFDLQSTLTERDNSLQISFTYNTDLFEASTIERMIGHFQALLEGIVANPEQRISELPLLTEAERHQLLVRWNDTRRDISRGKNVVAIFERQVELTPQAIAVVFENTRLTYRELNQRANQLAHYLIKQRVQAETSVAVCLERSLDLVIVTLAILKAGGVYVPLDANYPRERLSLMLQDIQAPLLVTVPSLEAQLSPHAAQSIFIETVQQDIAREDRSNPRLAIASDSPAYVLFTSGSTGKPKGVVMGHGALANLISWQVENFSEPLPARTLQFAPLGFDVSIQEMFSTWGSGGSLILIQDELRRDGTQLLEFLKEQSVERIFLPFVALQQLADAAAYGNPIPQNLREIITAGEQLQLTESLRSFLSRLGDCCLRNQYGPTESHVVTEFTLKPPFGGWPDLPPIGRPIANTEIYVLDSHLYPVPLGAVGQIYIGGVGLAHGYLNRPDLTMEKFIANPFSEEPTSRLYKTGDLARYLPDGNIVFLGRIDNQVKIRGYRIELGEIEAVLGQHPAVRQAIVLAREDVPGDKRLVGYLIMNEHQSLSASELRTYLKGKLPEYMVPSAYVFLGTFPLTPSGKVDRKALPVPEQSQPELQSTYVAPRTATEEVLAGIWAEVLKVDKVGVRDNFFDLGGHSLLAVRLTNTIQRQFKTPIRVAHVFEAPTVEQFALLLQRPQESSWSSLVPLNSQGSRRPFFWVHGEASDAYLTRYLGPDQPLYGLRHQSEDGQPALYRTVEEIAAHYLEEIRSVQPQGPYLLGGYCFGALVALEMAQRLQAQRQAIDLLVLIDPESNQTPNSQDGLQRSATRSLLHKLRHRRHAFMSLQPRDKWSYVVQRTKVKAREMVSNAIAPVKKITQKIAWETFVLLGLPIPLSMRSPYILEIYRKAMRGYAPRPYQGELVIFYDDDYPEQSRSQWSDPNKALTQVYKVPGNHTSVLEEPNVGYWAKTLKSCLDVVQQGALRVKLFVMIYPEILDYF